MINRLGLVLLPTLALSACSAGSTGDPPTRESTKATSAALTAPLRKVPQSANPYTLFETLQTRPLALSRDGETLYALNTPDNRLEIFKIRGDRIHPAGSVTVGLEPVAIAGRSHDGGWVVNHLSRSEERR